MEIVLGSVEELKQSPQPVNRTFKATSNHPEAIENLPLPTRMLVCFMATFQVSNQPTPPQCLYHFGRGGFAALTVLSDS